jgi:protein SCO1/2
MMFVTRCSRVAAVGALLGAYALAACGSSGSVSLSGVVRTPKLQVGSVQVTDVRTAASRPTFATRARSGGLLLVYFGYTSCPDVCPTTLADIRAAFTKLGPDARRVELAFVTVDPARDTAPVLRKFVGQFVPAAHLLRSSSAAQLTAAEHAFLISAKALTDGTIDHSASVAVVDAHGTVLVEWPFGIEPAAMAHDLRVLLARVAA